MLPVKACVLTQICMLPMKACVLTQICMLPVKACVFSEQGDQTPMKMGGLGDPALRVPLLQFLRVLHPEQFQGCYLR